MLCLEDSLVHDTLDDPRDILEDSLLQPDESVITPLGEFIPLDQDTTDLIDVGAFVISMDSSLEGNSLDEDKYRYSYLS